MINGELIDLTAGPYEARIATSGAGLVHLRRDGRDLVDPYDAESSLPSGWQGKVIAPWPNRIAGSRYVHGGEEYLVDCNEPDTGCANHGLVSWADWQVTARTESSLVLELVLPASYGYPWSLELEASFSLHPVSGLSASLRATCLGAALPRPDVVGAASDPTGTGPVPAPYGAAAHPYLTRGTRIDDCVLELPGAQVLDVDEHKVPTALRPVDGTDLDWRGGRRIGGTVADNAYTDMPDGVWSIRLRRADGGPAVVLSSDAPWSQIYTAEHMDRRCIAVEPMTCPGNSFNTGEGLVTLGVGESHVLAWTIHEED